MITLVSVLLGLPVAAGEGSDGKYTLAPRFVPGQELVYSGTVVETNLGRQGVKYEQPYELEATMLVQRFDARKHAEVGCFTVLRLPDRDPTITKRRFDNVASFHFDQVKVSQYGLAKWGLGVVGDAHIALPPDGQTPWEMSYLLEIPDQPVQTGGSWTLRRPGQPIVVCQVAGPESANGEPCVKIVCHQQSQNWTTKNLSVTAWRNSTTVWIGQKNGLVQRVRREYQVREPGDLECSRTTLADYSQVSNLQYAGPELLERTADFESGVKAQMDYEKLSVTDRTAKSHLASIASQLKFALEKAHSTPYRPALVELAKMVETSQEHVGHVRRPAPLTITAAKQGAAVGKKARHFVIHDVEKDESMTLRKLHGKAVVVVFVDPENILSQRALKTAMEASSGDGPRAEVYAVCATTEPKAIEEMKQRVFGSYRVCKLNAIDRAYGVDVMPHIVFIDADGILRGNYHGYGPELHTALAKEVSLHGKPAEKMSKKDAKSSFFR